MVATPASSPVRHRLVLGGLILGCWCGLVAWASLTQNLPLLPLETVIATVTIPLAWTDIRQHRLPNEPMVILYVLAASALAAAWALGERRIAPAAIGAAVWCLVIGGLWLAGRGRGMGAGDVKLALVLGAGAGAVGVGSAVVSLGLAFLLGGLAGLVALASGRRGSIPFGPALVGGWLVGLVLGAPGWAALVGR